MLCFSKVIAGCIKLLRLTRSVESSTMSDVLKLKAYISNVSTCAICLNVHTIPKTLPCNHSFCLACIQEYCNNLMPGNESVCPTCRARFEILEGGVERLPTNFVIEGLVNLCPTPADLIDGAWQQPTLDESAVTASGTRPCITGEQQQTAAGEEPQASASGSDSNENLSVQPSGLCSHHGQTLTIYCQKCRQNLCVECYFSEHPSHDGSTIEKIYHSFKDSLKQDIKQITSVRDRVYKERNDLELERRQFLDETDRIECAVNRNVTGIIQRLNEVKGQLMGELANTKASTLKQAAELSSELDSKLAEFNSFLEQSHGAVDSNIPWRITQDYDDLHRQAEMWLKCDQSAATDFLLSSITVNPCVVFDEIAGFSLVNGAGKWR